MPESEKKTYQEFAQIIKAKYPEYKDVDDHDLATKMIEKHPEYKDQVTFDAPVEKKKIEPNTQSTLPSGNGISGSDAGVSVQQGRNANLGGGQNAPMEGIGATEQQPVIQQKPVVKQPLITGTDTIKMVNGVPVFNDTPQVDQGALNTPLKSAATTQETTAKDQANYNPELQKKLKKGDLTEAVLRGTGALGAGLARTPAFLYDVGSSISHAFGLPGMTSAEVAEKFNLPDNQLALQLEDAVKNSYADVEKKYDKSITDYFSNGEYEKGFDKLSIAVAEAVPVTIGLVLSKGAGASAFGSTVIGGAVFGAEKKAELDKEHPEMSNDKKTVIAAANGLAEGLFEQFGVTKLGGVVKDVLLKEGKDAAIKIAKEGFLKTYSKIATRYLGTTAEEGLSEAATQFAQNAIDKYSGVSPDLDLTKGVSDAFIVGIGSGTAYSAPVSALEVAKTSASRKKAKDLTEQKATLENDIQSPDITDEAKSSISNKIKDINEQEAEIATKEKKNYESLPDEQKQEVSDVVEKNNKTEQSLQDPNISDQTREILEKDIEANNKKVDSIYEESKNKNQQDQEQQKQDHADEVEYLKGLKDSIGLNEEESSRLSELENKTKTGTPKEQPPTTEKSAAIKDIEQKIVDNKKKFHNDEQDYIDYRHINDTLNSELEEARKPEPKIDEVKAEIDKAFDEGKITEEQKTELSSEEQAPVAEEKLSKDVTSNEDITPKTEQNATQERNVEQSDIVQHKEGDISGQTTETSDSNSAEQNGKVQEKELKTKKTETNGKKTSETEQTDETIATGENSKAKDKSVLKEEIVDQEELADSQRVEDPATLKKMDDDLTVMKSFDNKELLQKKFVGMVERAWKAKESGKIKKTSYTAFRNKANDILGGKLNLDKEELKFKSTAIFEGIKNKLLGEGYTKVLLSSPGPVTPKTVADLIDLTNKLVHRGIDAGFAISEAASKAIAAIKKHPTYKKLLKNGEIVEKDFEDVINKTVVEKNTEVTKIEDQPIFGEEKVKKTAKRLSESEDFKDVVDNMEKDESFYQSINIKKASKFIDETLDQFEKSNSLEELAKESLKDNSPFHVKIQNLADFKLADRLRSLAQKEGGEMQKNGLNKLAADIMINRNHNTNIAATQTALEVEVAKMLPLSEEGLHDYTEATMSQVQNTYLTEAQKKDIRNYTNDINALIESTEGQKAIREAVESEIDRMAEKTKGKEWVNKVNTLDELKIDLLDC